MFRNIRTRLTGVFTGLAIGPLILVVTVVGARSFTGLEQQSLSLQRELARRVGGELRAFIEERQNELVLLENVEQFAARTPDEQRLVLENLLFHRQVYQSLVLVDVNGREQVHVSRNGRDLITTDENWAETEAFLVPATRGDPYFGPVHFDTSLREPLMSLSFPIVNLRSGDMVYVLIADLRFKPIWDLLARIDVPATSDVYVTDRIGRIVAHRDPSVVLRNTAVDIADTEGRTNGLTGDKVFAAQEVLTFGQQEFVVVAEQPVSEALELAYDTMRVAVVVTLIVLVLVGFLVVLSARHVVRPIEDMAQSAQAIGRGDFSQAINVSTRDEIYTLASAFNHMRQQLNETMTALQQEVAERTQAEAALRESEIRYRSLFEDSPTSLWEEDWTEVRQLVDSLHDSDYPTIEAYFAAHPEAVLECVKKVKIVDVNQATLELHEAPDKGFLRAEGMSVIFTDDALDVFRDEVIALAEGKTHCEAEALVQTVAGKPIHTTVRLAVAPGYEESWSRIFVSAVDISARKRVEDQRMALAVERERMRLLTDFITNVSHEFRTPLSVINTYVYLLEQPLGPEKRASMCEVINNQVTYIGELVDAMLTTSRLDSTSVEANFKPLDINAILRNIETQFRGLAQSNHHAFSVQLAPALPSIQGDEQKLHLALREFVKNGFQFTRDGGAITIETRVDAGEIIVEVRDTGIGIDDADIPRIFNHFFRVDKARTTRATGLGLALAKRIIDIHHGRIEVQSQLGSGSTFRIFLKADSAGPVLHA